MEDRLGINRMPLGTVTVTPVQGPALDDLNKHLDKLEAVAGHILTAVKDIRSGANQKNGKLMVSGVRNVRNWTATAVVASVYIETLLGADAGKTHGYSQPVTKFYLYQLFERAAKLGFEDAIETRRRLNVRPIDPWAQLKWDGQIK